MSELQKLVVKWRKKADDLSRLNRLGNYPDHTARVRQHMIMTTLRRCANALQRQIKKQELK